MKKQTSLDALNASMFETIEMLKNQNDQEADDHEKIDVPTAKAIAELGNVIVESYKVKAQALKILSKTEGLPNPELKALAEGVDPSENQDK